MTTTRLVAMNIDPSNPIKRSFHGLIDWLYAQLAAAFRAHGWQVERDPAGGPPGYRADFLLERDGRRYVAELRVSREARRPELPALLADAHVRAGIGARAHDAAPLAIVGAPAISDELARDLADYAGRFFEGEAWGLVDGHGRLELHGPGLDEIAERSRPARKPAAASRASPGELFSDLGQWLLKVLLARHLEPRWLRARRDPVRSGRELAGIAGVSVPTATRTLSRLRQLGFLAEEAAPELVRIDELLALWRGASRQLEVEVGYRWLLPPRDSRARLESVLEAIGRERLGPERTQLLAPEEVGWRRGPRLCLGLFAACEKLGLGFAQGVPLHLYLEDPSAAELERLGLVPAEPGRAVDVFVRVPRSPEAVFRANVVVAGVPVADAVQCWLELVDHPARGAEQAEHLRRRVLAPLFAAGVRR